MSNRRRSRSLPSGVHLFEALAAQNDENTSGDTESPTSPLESCGLESRSGLDASGGVAPKSDLIKGLYRVPKL